MIESEIKEHDLYKYKELVYLPREAFVEAITNAFYKLYYPSQNQNSNFNLWVSNV